MVADLAVRARALPDDDFMAEFRRLLIGVQNKLGTFGPAPP